MTLPASLKAVIDWHFTQWQRKAIAFAGYSGPDSFTYKANDGSADSAAAVSTIASRRWS